MADLKYYDVILKPVVTEKSMTAMAEKKYTFYVNPDATKTQVKEAVEKFGSEKIVVGIDAMNGMVATEGWLEASDVNYIQLANEMIKSGVKYFIFTDISKDGTLSGVNAEQLQALYDGTDKSCRIIASGGGHTMDDIIKCKAMGLYGTICGKSIYKGTLDLKEAIDFAQKG